MSENELDARVAQLYHRTSVWVRFEVRADGDDEAMTLVRDQLDTDADRGATLRAVRVDPPHWEAAPVIPPSQIELPGEANVQRPLRCDAWPK